MATTQQPSIRDLIAELADTEDVLRGCRVPAGPLERSARRRQGELVTELRRRHGECAAE
ncbi:MAG: hypothetical protein ACJ714_08775 [Ornithinibacter sp.]